jgi:aldose 1-epimerase
MIGPDGERTNVVLGFDSLQDYIADTHNVGALIGRYANRIARGKFRIGDKLYQVSTNEGDHSLHGGRCGFDRRVWYALAGPKSLTLTYTSKSGEEGYPGALRATVRYSLTCNELRLDYEATTTSDTPVNLTNHVYFNFTGDSQAEILGHVVTLHAERFTPVSSSLIPTGELRRVRRTAFDFLEPHAIEERIDSEDPQLHFAHGYDHNWVSPAITAP